MRVLYSGGTICNFQTLQRLVLLADEVGFMDRPSVTFGNFGTIGIASDFRRIDTSGAPIRFSVHEPPPGPASELYLRYLDADLKNPHFVRVVLDGLRSNPLFQGRLIQLEANYQWGTGEQVLESLLADPTLATATFNEPIDGRHLYAMGSQVGRRQTLQALLLEASIHVTNALVVAEATQLVPVSDDPFFCQLLALRTCDESYIAQSDRLASHLGLAIAKSVLPDQLLADLKMQDLFDYRRSAKDVYSAWSQEIDRLAVRLSDLPPERLDDEVAKIVVTEVRPKLLEFRNEMASARDRLFGDLIKTITRWELPTISLAYLASLNVATAIATFAAALTPAVPPLVDYFTKRRDLTRRNSMAYLVGVSSSPNDEP